MLLSSSSPSHHAITSNNMAVQKKPGLGNDICCNLSFLITFQLNWAPRHQLRHYDKMLSLLGCLVDICQSHNKFDALQFKNDIYSVLKIYFLYTPTEQKSYADVICLSEMLISNMNQTKTRYTSIWLLLCSKNFRNIEVIILRAKPCQDSPKQFDKIFSKCRGMTNWLVLDLTRVPCATDSWSPTNDEVSISILEKGR